MPKQATGLTPEGRLKLVKVLGLLASSFDGERAAAGLLATRMVAEAGVSWESLLGATKTLTGWQRDVEFCAQHFECLTGWEISFLLGLRSFANPSSKQLKHLRSIAQKLREAGLA